jgi:transcriptional regulator with XRE-family HTH domain
VDPFPLAGVLRRIRRIGDWSQRELAERIGASKAAVAAAENGTRDLPVSLLARAAASAGGRLVVVDAEGHELAPMDPGAVRDAGRRRFPAHLDTRYSDEGWWHGPHRYSRRTPTYTFDRRRGSRDGVRRFTGVPEDHLRPQPGDSPAERAAERQRAAWGRRDEERRRRFRVVGSAEPDWGSGCTCPPGCEYAEGYNEDLTHASDCPCRCDVA